MTMTSEAHMALEAIVNESNGDLMRMVSDYYSTGICTECGEMRDGVEPDAQGYECYSCGSQSVSGIEIALLDL